MDHKILRGLITGGAAAAIIVHAFFPSVTVDAITLGFLTIAVLPWVAPIISKVELPGGLKIELQKLDDKVKEAAGAAQSATTKAEAALAISGTGSSALQSAQENQSDSGELISALAKEYNDIRQTQDSGPARTRAMTDVVGKMIKIASALTDYELSRDLASRDRGRRLFGYSYLYSRPNFSELERLVRTVVEVEDTPFGQYWGIQAISRLISSKRSEQVPSEIKRLLSDFRSKIPLGTDREYELNQILASL
jgi:hypothetical protein